MITVDRETTHEYRASGYGKEAHMEEMGMTDLQFKSFIMLLIKQLEDAKTEAEKQAIIEQLKQMLQG